MFFFCIHFFFDSFGKFPFRLVPPVENSSVNIKES